MAELRPTAKAVFRVGTYSMSAGISAGRVFDDSQEAFEHFMELADKHLTAQIRSEFISEWHPADA